MQLLDYVISSFYPEIQAAHASDSVQRNAAFFREVSGPHATPPCGWVLGVPTCVEDTLILARGQRLLPSLPALL